MLFCPYLATDLCVNKPALQCKKRGGGLVSPAKSKQWKFSAAAVAASLAHAGGFGAPSGCDMQWIFGPVTVPVVFSLKWILSPPLMNPNAAGHVPHGHREL